jgi:hypothetical protein
MTYVQVADERVRLRKTLGKGVTHGNGIREVMRGMPTADIDDADMRGTIRRTEQGLLVDQTQMWSENHPQ